MSTSCHHEEIRWPSAFQGTCTLHTYIQLCGISDNTQMACMWSVYALAGGIALRAESLTCVAHA